MPLREALEHIKSPGPEAAFAEKHGVRRISFEMHPGFCVSNPETLLRIRKAVGFLQQCRIKDGAPRRDVLGLGARKTKNRPAVALLQQLGPFIKGEEKMSNKIDMELRDLGHLTIELYPEVAPITVENFKNLVEQGFYDGLIFHRVIPGFMIQGGDPTGTGMGGPGHHIKGEFAANGVKNDLKHTRGVLSMARSMDPNSAGSQFFIMHDDAPHLDGQYAAFAMVVEGMEFVDAVAEAKTDWNDRPYEDQVIESVTFIEE